VEYRKLGRSGPAVSEIAFGNLVDAACVRAAIEEGVTTFLTDGLALDALAEGIAGTPRDELILCGSAVSVHDILRGLGTDHLDVVTVPRPDAETAVEEILGAPADLVRQGSVRHVALAEWTPEQIAEAATFDVPIVAAQAYYSMLWRVPETQSMAAAERAGLGHIACAPLDHGLLTGKYNDGAVPDGSRAQLPDAAGEQVRRMLRAEVLDRVELLAGVAALAGLTPAQLAVAWVLQNEIVTAAVVGATSPAQVRENCAASGTALELDTLIQVDSLLGTAIQTDPRLTGAPRL